jgi:hypothetical protein
MRSRVLKLARRSKTAIVAQKIYANRKMRRSFASGDIETVHGSTHQTKTIAESLSYIDEEFNDYLRYSGLQPENLQGKRVLELGFGDNVGVALKILASGATQVVCLDKFYSKRDQNQQQEIYKALRDTLKEDAKQRFDQAIDLRSGIEINSDRLKCINGMALEVAAAGLASERQLFDLIISRAVLEEIYEPDAVFLAMDGILSPGGCMLHKIDLSDYGMFRSAGMNPLTFLTISERVYRLMASDSGIPNRRPMSYYQDKIEELGYEAKILITELIDRQGKGDLHPHKEKIELGVDYTESTLAYVDQIRPQLSAAFRELPSEELIVAGIFLIARKPGARSQ